mmetsp:Transcript_23756/g.42624  ORF Transcript_23756/g.42624 Transcript_23756/m.42624 type:complete len:209 (+) Transcript_23756:1059-1685(+)
MVSNVCAPALRNLATPPRVPAGKNTSAQKRTFKRVVAVVAAAAKACDLSCCEEAGHCLAIRADHLAVQIGVQPAQRFAREDVQFDRNQRAVGRVQELVRLGCPQEPVAAIIAGGMDGHHLGVFGERIVDLCIARFDLGAQFCGIYQVPARHLVHPPHEGIQIMCDDKILALVLERLNRPCRVLAGQDPLADHLGPFLGRQIGVLFRPG